MAINQRLISAEAPGRVELLGNHTDYNEGLVVGAAIDRSVRVRGSARNDGRILLGSAPYSPVEIPLAELHPRAGAQRWANYSLGVANELLASGVSISGFSAGIESGLPVGAGLGSSAALSVATAFFLLKLAQRELPPLEIAKICRHSEHRFAGVQSGLLDQVMSIFGRSNQLVLFDCRTEEVRTIAFPQGLVFIVADSGSKRELVAGKYNQRREETRVAAEALGVCALRDIPTVAALYERRTSLSPILYRRAAHIIGENERVSRGCECLGHNDVRRLGELLNQSHESSRKNFENSTPELDRLVNLARKQTGVLGARLTGGGFGGAIIALCETACAEAAARNMASAATQAFICRPADGALARN